MRHWPGFGPMVLISTRYGSNMVAMESDKAPSLADLNPYSLTPRFDGVLCVCRAAGGVRGGAAGREGWAL